MAPLYGTRRWLAKHTATLVALAAMCLALGAGCASAPQTPPPKGIDEMGPPEILYRAAVSTYESRQIPIKLSSDKFLVVTGAYAKVGPNLRKRMATRVVRAARGAMGLKVTAEWQRRVEIDGEQRWQDVDTPELRERGNAEEIELGRAIEKRFESWKKQWKASND